MLWYKGWLETRLRLLFGLAFMCAFMIFFYSIGTKAPPPGAKPVVGVALFAMGFAATVSGGLSGAGINTQSSFQATKGLHGSMLFTLSLPVSRCRLLAVRAGLGWLEMTGVIGTLCCGLWLVFPALRGAVTAVEMFEYAGTLIACASACYSISVVLATFLDDLWRMFGSMIAFWALWGLSNYAPLPVSVNIVRAMGEGSPLLTHTMPWTAMGVSLALAAILFFAALKIVQVREY
jgi:ABC-2 type transport system permease protein